MLLGIPTSCLLYNMLIATPGTVSSGLPLDIPPDLPHLFLTFHLLTDLGTIKVEDPNPAIRSRAKVSHLAISVDDAEVVNRFVSLDDLGTTARTPADFISCWD